MAMVIDASVTLAWVFVDEWSEFTDALLGQLPQTRAVVPLIWLLEIANALTVAERRRRIARADSDRFIAELLGLPIEVDDGSLAPAFGTVLALARQTGLSVYDASYLELAQRRGLPLATQDRRLAAAAAQLEIPLVAEEQAS